METVNLIIALVTEIVAITPLVIALITFVKKSIKEKNWAKLVELTLTTMSEAEKLYTTGAEKKEYVIKTVLTLSKTINYDVQEEQIATLIETCIDLSKKVNVKDKH